MKKQCIFFHLFLPLICSAANYTEQNILHMIKLHLPDNPVVIEAGARFGEDTIKMSRLWPEGTIFAFEPYEPSFIKLQKTISTQNNTLCYMLGLSNKTGQASFYPCAAHPGTSSMLKPTSVHPAHQKYSNKPITINCITLDDFVQHNNISKVDFMWLDLEGFEMQVLQGGINMLQTVDLIYIELNFTHYWQGMYLYDTIKPWIEQQGFKELYKYYVRKNTQANVVFKRTSPA